MTLAHRFPAGCPTPTTFLYVSDGAKLYFWAKPNTRTARHIDPNSLVSFASTDCSATSESRRREFRAPGECSVLLSGEEIAGVADLFGQGFHRSPRGPR